MAVCIGMTALFSAMLVVPYPLKMDASGELWPEVRRDVFPTGPGTILKFSVVPNQVIGEDFGLAEMYDLELQKKVIDLKKAINDADKDRVAKRKAAENPNLPEADKEKNKSDADRSEREYHSKEKDLAEILDKTKG